MVADIPTANFTLKQRMSKLTILMKKISSFASFLEELKGLSGKIFSHGILKYPEPHEDLIDKCQCTSLQIKHYFETGNGDLIGF